MKTKHLKKIFYSLIAGVGVILFLYGLTLFTQRNSTVIVNDTNLQQNVYSGLEGETKSETVLRVYTSNGLFDIRQKGFFSHPEYFGKINVGDTLNVDYILFDFPVFGVYRVINKIN